jgi:hypothetical protein
MIVTAKCSESIDPLDRPIYSSCPYWTRESIDLKIANTRIHEFWCYFCFEHFHLIYRVYCAIFSLEMLGE